MRILACLLWCAAAACAVDQPTTLIKSNGILLRWQKNDLQYCFVDVPEEYRGPMRVRLAGAATYTTLNFTETTDEAGADLVFRWGLAFDSDVVACVYEVRISATGGFTRVGIGFNTARFDFYSGDATGVYGGRYRAGQRSAYDVEGTFNHELLHGLGLDHVDDHLSCMHRGLADTSHIIWPYDIECLRYLYPPSGPSIQVTDLEAARVVLGTYRERRVKYRGQWVTVLVPKGTLRYDANGQRMP